MPDTATYEKLVKLGQLSRFKGKQDEYNEGKFAPKGEFDAYKGKVDTLETTGGQPNVIESVKVNGSAVAVADKAVDIAVPTDNASLANGAGYQTAAQVASAVEAYGYQTASDVQSAIGTAIATAMDYKGVKAAKADLPASGNKTGDVWHVASDGSEYAWNGSEWEELGVTFDPTGFVQSSDITVATDEDIDALFEESGE